MSDNKHSFPDQFKPKAGTNAAEFLDFIVANNYVCWGGEWSMISRPGAFERYDYFSYNDLGHEDPNAKIIKITSLLPTDGSKEFLAMVDQLAVNNGKATWGVIAAFGPAGDLISAPVSVQPEMARPKDMLELITTLAQTSKEPQPTLPATNVRTMPELLAKLRP